MNREQIFSYLEERFGLDKGLFKDYEFLEGAKGRVFMATKDVSNVSKAVKAVIVGLLFCRVNGSVKLSGNITQLFGNNATKSVVNISELEARKFIGGEDLDVPDTGTTDGYVIVKYKNYPLGIGLLKESAIKNMIPKAKRTNLVA
ncbi:MAG: hypothetical protein HY512_04000 [Candidatus Aenigmarchaeota archaeon]|nr:hypothetical protein [Candidatus Aenigmarchaeota archaeon]